MNRKRLPDRMKCLIGMAGLGLVALISTTQPGAAGAASAPPLGALRQFGVLGGSGVTGATGAGVAVNGDVGSSPTATITNFGPSTVLAPFVLHLTNDVVVQQARADAATAALDLANQGPGTVLAAQLAGQVLTAGSYSFASTADLAAGGILTLNGPGVFVFNVTSALTANVGSTVVGTAAPCSVYWRVGSDATLNGNSFLGTVITDTGFVTVGAGANVTGRVVAATAVTMAGAGSNTIGGCSALPSLAVLKSMQTHADPVNITANPKAIPGAEILYTITVTNSGYGVADNDTTVVKDLIPANMSICVSTLCSDPPVKFSCSPDPDCGLAYAYDTDVSYSNQIGGGEPYTYIPLPDGFGYDANVTEVRINPTGVFNGASGGNNPLFNLILKMKIK